MNRTLRNTAVGVATATLGLGLAAPAAATPSVTYHGYYDGVTTYTPNDEGGGYCPADTLRVDGTWNVRIAGDRSTATMSTNLFYDGVHHLAYGGGFDVVSSGEHSFQIVAESYTQDGTSFDITLTLTESGELVYTVAPYQLFGKDCKSLTLSGHEGRPALP